MESDETLLKRRFTELAERSANSGIYTFTEFLAPAEKSILEKTVHGIPYGFFGGYDSAEKEIAYFGSLEICGYDPVLPITFLKIEPASMKFSEELAHRDFLGAIMSLGIKRNTLGDLLVKDNICYTVCLENMADYICENLLSIKRTSILCSKIEALPDDIIPKPVESSFVITSERFDSVISSIYKLSRSESQGFFEHEKVFVGGIPVTNYSHSPKSGDIITVRGKGKFIYCGIERETKKGRLRCIAKIYK